MSTNSVQKDLKLTKAEREKEQQAEAYQQLMFSYPLPDNISEMKSFAFGNFTWRDVVLAIGSEFVGVVLLLPMQIFIPLWLCVIIGAIIALPLAFLSIKHVFTGDLPFEERVKIELSERGQTNLLHWDKTKDTKGRYVGTSTQSFVPELTFSEENYAMLPNNEGGFAVIELAVDDISQAKNTDLVGVVNSFKRMLDSLIKDADCTPIQIMLKSIPKNLKDYIDSSEQRAIEIENNEKYMAAERAVDYAELLQALDNDHSFYHKYYIVITYRQDAEKVAEDTMDTVSVRRKKIQDKGLNPLNKRAKLAKDTNFTVGMTEEDRRRAMKERNKEAEFGQLRTKEALDRRVGAAVNMLRDLGSTHTDVKPRLLTQHEIAKLVFECYNSEDKNVVDDVLAGALTAKDTIYSAAMYRSFPELFALPKKKKSDKTLQAQKTGSYTSREA